MARTSKAKTIAIPPKLLIKIEQYQEETGIGLSALVQMSLNTFFEQRDAINAMNNITPLLQKLEEMQQLQQKKGE
jgi:hypothetical protein